MRTLSKLPKYQQIHYFMEYVLFLTYFTISINHPQNTTSDMISVLSGKKKNKHHSIFKLCKSSEARFICFTSVFQFYFSPLVSWPTHWK